MKLRHAGALGDRLGDSGARWRDVWYWTAPMQIKVRLQGYPSSSRCNDTVEGEPWSTSCLFQVFLYCGQYFTAADLFGDTHHVRIEGTIIVGDRYLATHQIINRLGDAGSLVHVMEIQGLATHQQLNGQHRFQFFGNLVGLDGGVISQADQILLVGAGRGTVDRGRE